MKFRFIRLNIVIVITNNGSKSNLGFPHNESSSLPSEGGTTRNSANATATTPMERALGIFILWSNDSDSIARAEILSDWVMVLRSLVAKVLLCALQSWCSCTRSGLARVDVKNDLRR